MAVDVPVVVVVIVDVVVVGVAVAVAVAGGIVWQWLRILVVFGWSDSKSHKRTPAKNG